MMKKRLFLLTIIIYTTVLQAEWSYHYMFGGRYDNLRMCVATPAGVKGGPVGDIQMDILLSKSETGSVILNLPVMRPILFGTAFRMLQFEPEITFEKYVNDRVFGPGIGISVHYGPDYQSDLNNRTADFWAAGPFLSYLYGKNFNSQRLALRGFYTPLFSKAHHPGTVLGLSLEYYRHLN